MSVALSARALAVLKEFPKILDELAAGVHAYTKWADRSKGILTRGKELRRGKRDSSKKELQVQRRTEERELLGKTGSQNWSLAKQEKKADERARAVIKDLKNRYISRPYTDKEGLLKEGNAYFLNPAQEAKLKELLYPIKLKEIQEGTPYIQRLTIGHRYPNVGVFERGGELKGRGFTTWENITDDAGNLNLVPMLENIRATNIVPDEFRAMIPAGGALGATSADASILSSRFTPKELQERKDLAASRRQWVGEKLHYLNPVLNSLTGPFSKGTPNMKPWQKKMKDPTWGGGLLR